MTKERLQDINNLQDRLDSAEEYVDLAKGMDSVRKSITFLLSNAPQLVSLETAEACWDLMLVDANTEINRLQKEFNEA
jgi:hypothetical protein